MTSSRRRLRRRCHIAVLRAAALMAAHGVAMTAPAFGSVRTPTETLAPTPAPTSRALPTVTVTPTAGGGAAATVLAGTSTPAPTVQETAGPLGLADRDTAEAAVQCQEAFSRSAGRLVRIRFRSFAKCEKRFQRCVQLRPNDPGCLAGAGERCARALTKMASEEARRTASAVRRCPASVLPPEALLGSNGLGFEAIVAECEAEFGIVPDDTASIIACVLRQHACHVERMVEVLAPRTKELMRLPAGGGVNVGPLACLPDHGGVGGSLGDGLGAALTRCAGALAKAGAAFVRRGMQRHAQCLEAIFRCVQLDPEGARCLERATALCDKRLTRAARDEDRLARALGARCDEARIPYGDLRDADGAHLGAIEAVCSELGLLAPSGLAGYRECLVRNEICRTAELVRFAVPRAGELLGRVGRRLGAGFCPATLPLETASD